MFFTRKRVIVYLSALLAMQVFTWISGAAFVRTGFIDFRTFYTAGYMVRSGNSAALYDYNTEQQFQSNLISPESRALPMMCPPYTALLFVPLSFLTFHNAYNGFFFINFVLLLLSAAVTAPYLNFLSDRWSPAPFVLWLAFLPAGIALIMGQISAILLILYCLCFTALQDNRPLLAGLFLSLALIKFQIALPVALLFLLWRQWHFVTGFLVGATGVITLSAAVVGGSHLLPYLRSLFFMTNAITPEPSLQSHFAIFPRQMPNLYGLFFAICKGSTTGFFFVIAASLILFTWTATRPPSLPLALLTGVLVSYHLFLYDLTVLLLPLSLTLNRFISEDGGRRNMEMRLSAASASRRSRHLPRQAAAAVLLIAPCGRFLIAANAIYLLALPIIVLTLADQHDDFKSRGTSTLP